MIKTNNEIQPEVNKGVEPETQTVDNLAQSDFAIRAGGVEPPHLSARQHKSNAPGTPPTSYPHGGNNPMLQVGPRNIPNRRIMV